MPEEFPYHVTVKATSPKGEVTYITKGGETVEEAHKKAIRWGVAYYLYDNGHITGEHAARTASSVATEFVKANTDHFDYDGFAFEVMPVDLLTGV